MKKNFLIFGGTSGIGLEVLKKYIKKNIYFYVVGRNFVNINKLKIEKKKLTNIKFDLNNNTTKFPFAKLPKLDYLLVSSGITELAMASSINDKLFDKILNINLLKIAKLISHFIYLKKFNQKASIVIVSSIGGNNTVMPGQYAYSISKAGLTGMVKSLALELSNLQVRVNAVNPGMTKTNMIKNYLLLGDNYFSNKDKKKYPLYKDYLNAKDVANLIDFLLSSKSKSITGQSIVIDNGYTLNK